jgi:hypothetical protein
MPTKKPRSPAKAIEPTGDSRGLLSQYAAALGVDLTLVESRLDMQQTAPEAAPWWFPKSRHAALLKMARQAEKLESQTCDGAVAAGVWIKAYMALMQASPEERARTHLQGVLFNAAAKGPVSECPHTRVLALLFASIAGDLSATPAELIAELDGPLQARRITGRHAPRRVAREAVRNEWQRDRQAYGGNKTDFARAMARRLLIEQGLEVTDRTIREDWLRGL